MLLFLLPALVYSQDTEVAKFPNRPISYIQPFTAGSPADIAIRLITREAEKILGQPIAVINRAGGGGSIGTASIATAKPDGYTIGNAPQGPMIFVPLLEKVPYHPVKDLKMIMQFASFNMGIIVRGDSPFKSFKDIIEYARQNPKKLSYGSTGANAPPRIVIDQIAKREKVELTYIPFKASNDTQTAVLGGHIHFGAGDFTYSLVESGETRVVLLFREERAAEYPTTPIMKDLGYDLPFPSFICVAGPKGLPDGIVKKLEEAFTKAMKEPSFINGMKEIRLPVVYRNSQEFSDYIAYNYEYFGKVLKEMGFIK